jgi:outer membrane assembly lipoprotein YfiO
MIKTRKHTVLSTFLVIIIAGLVATGSLSTLCNNSTVAEHQFEVTLPVTENLSRNNRMRKPKNKKKKTKKIVTYLDMEYEQLVVAKDKQKAKENISATIKYLEQLLKMCNDVTLLAGHLLELGDVFFIDGQFQKSALIYNQYCALYPGSEKQEYALYRSIVSSFACILSYDRDQTKTEETVTLTELFLKQDHFKQYKEEVAQIQKQCHEQLAISECNVCTFYLNKGSLKAAEKRLTKIRSFWLPKLPTLEPEIIALEAQLAEKREMTELLNLKNSELAQKQNEKNEQLAHNKKTRRMMERF